MKKHEMEQEKKRIYQDWLNGVRIEDLARKYHHWRCVIVMILREQARASASVHNQQVTAGQQATKCLRQEWEPPEEIKKNIILLSLAGATVPASRSPSGITKEERKMVRNGLGTLLVRSQQGYRQAVWSGGKMRTRKPSATVLEEYGRQQVQRHIAAELVRRGY